MRITLCVLLGLLCARPAVADTFQWTNLSAEFTDLDPVANLTGVGVFAWFQIASGTGTLRLQVFEDAITDAPLVEHDLLQTLDNFGSNFGGMGIGHISLPSALNDGQGVLMASFTGDLVFNYFAMELLRYGSNTSGVTPIVEYGVRPIVVPHVDPSPIDTPEPASLLLLSLGSALLVRRRSTSPD